jgi:ABC-type transport system involved in multi-copper enzyme maturation permease subunit
MLTQTAALFYDAYRELNSKKLFWITLILSGACVAAFGAVGINEEGITALWFTIPVPVNSSIISPELFYKTVFLNLGIGIWLTWIATVLALVSTAGIFPSMLTGGQIETMLSKPISRTRLFLTKFTTGLFFVGLQVSLFCVASILVIGFRSGSWMPEIFLAIPIVVVFFSFLFSVMTLFGVLTRSTIASLLLTILFWFILFIVNVADQMLVSFHESMKLSATAASERLVVANENATLAFINQARSEGQELADSYQPTEPELDSVNVFLPVLRDSVKNKERSSKQLAPWRNGIFVAKTILPKTGETINLLTKHIMSQEDMDAWMSVGNDDDPGTVVDDESGDVRVSNVELNQATAKAFNDRPLWWVLGTSLGFEAVMLLIAGFIFRRTDF